MRNTLNLFMVALLAFSCEKADDAGSPIVARVGNSALTADEVERIMTSISMRAYSKTDVISNWIDRELLFLAAQDAGIENDEILKNKIDVYRKDLFGRTFLDNFTATNITVGNSEIREYYDTNRSMFRYKNDGAKIIHFLVQIDTIADYVAETLNSSGESVDRKELLSNYMADVITIEKGNLVDVLDNAVFSNSRTNIVLGPLETDFGYHVIEVLNRYRPGSQIDLDEAYDEIYQTIYNRKKQLRSVALIDSLRNHYNVKIYLEND